MSSGSVRPPSPPFLSCPSTHVPPATAAFVSRDRERYFKAPGWPVPLPTGFSHPSLVAGSFWDSESFLDLHEVGLHTST